MIKKLDQWHKTKVGLLAFGLVELAIAYGFVSLAIDRGNFWWYILTIVFLAGGIQDLVKLIWKFFHDDKRKTA